MTLFGESHGPVVGALVEGVPAGIEVDAERLRADLSARRPGGEFASKRREDDECHLLSGVNDGRTTAAPILLLVVNKDARGRDYSFLPDLPRPGHADLPEMARTGGHSDLRGGGINSARLTVGLVAAASITRPILDDSQMEIEAHVHSIGEITSKPIEHLSSGSGDLWEMTRCRDEAAAAEMVELLRRLRGEGDSIGSSVELRISGLPLGFGQPWFDGLEPVLASALMAIPGARAVEFGRGFEASKMRGSEHNDGWQLSEGGITPTGIRPDGSLGGMATSADLFVKVHFKPPSSIARDQKTLNIKSMTSDSLMVKGRHDPVIGPRAVSVVEATARLVISDLALRSCE